jgi:3-phenylpropionate/trans-cinnamate dioxygenase ferredoxin component
MPELLKVANLSELPAGGAMAVEVAGKAIALFNVNGKIYALDNTCRHRGGPLGEGTVEGDVVTCPWHGWEYKIPSGEFLGNASIKVETFPVQVENGEIKVEL